MAADPLPPPLPRPVSAGIEAEEEGPLWNTIKRQLYRPEVSHVKRLVGEALIQQNRAMWDELTSLRQIMADFEQQSEEISEGMKRQMQLCGTQHRDLLRRQAQIITEDLRSQATACGHVLEDLVPEFRDEALRDYVAGNAGAPSVGDTLDGARCRATPPMTPSTRPPSSCGGVSGCSTPDVGLPPLPLGRPLGVDELGSVAEGIREALETEQESLLALICEQMQRFEAEEARRASNRAGPTREPSTATLQGLVRKLQDLAVSPSLRSLMVAGGCMDDVEVMPRPITGGANVRRLKALIAERRRCFAGPPVALGAVPEVAGMSKSAFNGGGGTGSPVKVVFDPFFGDPFAAET